MGATGDRIDDLIEWQPGVPQAARPGVFAAFAWGLRCASQCKALIFWLWLLQFLLVHQALRGWFPPTGAPLAASEAPRWTFVLEASSRLWTLGGDLSETMAGALERPLWSPDAYFILLYGVLAGGAISYLHARRKGAFLARFGAASGLYLGRMLRLLIIGALGLWVVLAAVGGLAPAAADRVGWLELVVFEAAVSLLALTIDYARVRTVVRDSRSMVLEVLRSLRFVLRHFPRVLFLQALLLGLGVAAAAAVLLLARGLEAAGAGVLGVFVATQAYVIVRIWARLAMWGAMLSLYQGLTAARLAASSSAADG